MAIRRVTGGNEDGKRLALAPSRKATEVFGDGHVVVCEREELE